MLEGHKPSTISLSSTIVSRDLGYGLVLEYKKRLYLTFLVHVFLVLFYSGLALASIQIAFIPMLSTLLSILLAVVTMLCLYYFAVTYLDTAIFMVTKERIDLKRGPFPPFKTPGIDTKHIASVFQQQRVVAYKSTRWWSGKWYGLRFESSPTSEDLYVRYIIGVITVDGKRIDLLREIPSDYDAKTLRESIQHRLGILQSPDEDELKSLFANSGFWNRFTHSSSGRTFNGSPLFLQILGAVFVVWATLELASEQVRKGGRWSKTMVSFSTDPTYFVISVLMMAAMACYCFYRSWKRFEEPSDRGGFFL
jgi:hypothetical protein